MNIIVRAYNEGIAFRYHFPETTNGLFLHIVGEQTSFTMPEGTMAYYERWAQGPCVLRPLEGWGKEESERPLTLKLPDGLSVALLEAEWWIMFVVNSVYRQRNLPLWRQACIVASILYLLTALRGV